eukprot:CAMPEP_0168739202 /NCGR_PEP_ID=MMETSP0724-20121128/11331_1 /TAXON_ID=265536 /ORGANISM="Amphiprora sp., Strain CCMP467" /LENGTH=550 /DNA_ID=CAMNT_0008786577 /DNA_START=58 /DNA_END=1707 /DNA_ORIENTATION=-
MYFLTTLIEECCNYVLGPPALPESSNSPTTSKGQFLNFERHQDDAFIDYQTLLCDDNCWSDIFFMEEDPASNIDIPTEEDTNNSESNEILAADDTTYHTQQNTTKSSRSSLASSEKVGNCSVGGSSAADLVAALTQKEQEAQAHEEYLAKLSQEIQSGTYTSYFYGSSSTMQDDDCQEPQEDEAYLVRLEKEIRAGSFYFCSPNPQEEDPVEYALLNPSTSTAPESTNEERSRPLQNKDIALCESSEEEQQTPLLALIEHITQALPATESSAFVPISSPTAKQTAVATSESFTDQSTTAAQQSSRDESETISEASGPIVVTRPFDEVLDDILRPFDEDPVDDASDPTHGVESAVLRERIDEEGDALEVNLRLPISVSSSLSSDSLSMDSGEKTRGESEVPIAKHVDPPGKHMSEHIHYEKETEELDDDRQAAKMLVSMSPSTEDDESGEDESPSSAKKEPNNKIEAKLKHVSYDASLLMLSTTKAPPDSFEKSLQKRVRRHRSNGTLSSSQKFKPVTEEKTSTSLDMLIAASSSVSTTPSITEVSDHMTW